MHGTPFSCKVKVKLSLCLTKLTCMSEGAALCPVPHVRRLYTYKCRDLEDILDLLLHQSICSCLVITWEEIFNLKSMAIIRISTVAHILMKLEVNLCAIVCYLSSLVSKVTGYLWEE
jgi:hypothetical protein